LLVRLIADESYRRARDCFERASRGAFTGDDERSLALVAGADGEVDPFIRDELGDDEIIVRRL
jgi:hypothetical protein